MKTLKTVVTIYFYDNVVVGPLTRFAMHSIESVMRLLHNALPTENRPGTNVLFGKVNRCVPTRPQTPQETQDGILLSSDDYIYREDACCEVQILGTISDEEIGRWIAAVAGKMRSEGVETSVWYTIETKVFHHA